MLNVKLLTLGFLILLVIASCNNMPLTVKADSKVIVVPDDYPTIASAIGNATNGDTIFVKEGAHDGPINQTLIIDKSLWIIGENAPKTILNLFPAYDANWIVTTPLYDYSDAINIKTNNVTISNLTINVNPAGSLSLNSNNTQISGNIINTDLTVKGSYNKIIQNTIAYLSISGPHNFIEQNYIYRLGNFRGICVESSFNNITKNLASTIFLNNANSNTINDNTCERLHFSYINQPCSDNVVYRNNIEPFKDSSNNQGGILLSWGSNNVFYENNISNFSSGNGVELNTRTSGNNTFYHNNLINNNQQVYVYNIGESEKRNFFDNDGEGNFWDSYTGTDANGDGIGDTPYVIDVNNVDHYPLMNPLGVSAPQVWLGFSQTMLIIISIVVLMIVVAGLLVYHKKQRHSLDAV